MDIKEFLTIAWSPEPWVIVCAAAMLALYTLTGCMRRGWRSYVFVLGLALMVLSVVSPLGYLGRNYLLSAHMVQHILLLLVVPVLLLSGIPEDAAERALGVRPLGSAMKALGSPIIAWTLGVGSMWAWHMPSIHDAVIANDNLYTIQQMSFVFIGVLFWWPVFAPVESARLSPLHSTLYLASACLGCTVLGILLTFAGTGLYASYLNPQDAAGILPYLRDDLCLTPGVDQQIAGLTMWVPGCLIYLTASMITLARWYAAHDTAESAASPGPIIAGGAPANRTTR